MPMDGRVLEAAVTGDSRLMKDLASQDPSVLLGITPQGNTCLHIASIHGLRKEVRMLIFYRVIQLLQKLSAKFLCLFLLRLTSVPKAIESVML
jgi:hypothetical protein